jgi:hypothetical protein
MDDYANGGGQTLNGWKDIAAYLGKSVRSAQRWEMTLGLPVRRIKTPDGQIVYAHPHEIDDWRRQRDANGEDWDHEPAGPAPQVIAAAPALEWRAGHWTLAPAAVVLVLVGFAVGWLMRRPDVQAVEIRYVGRAIEALASNGAVLWTYTFDADVSAPRRGPLFLDIDGDDAAEILVPVRRTPIGGAKTSDELICFTRQGDILWRVAPDTTMTFGPRSYSAPWDLRDFVVGTTPAQRSVWVAYAHHTWFPGFVLQVDPDGSARLHYSQAGALYSVAHWTTPAGNFLAIGGTSEEHAYATLALVPEFSGPTSFPAGRPALRCAGCPDASPSRVLLIAPAELTAASNEVFPYVAQLRVVGPTLKMIVADGPGRSVVDLGPDFSITSMQFGQHYWAAHRRLEAAGRLDHSGANCPERMSPREIQEWTPDAGWRTSAVAPVHLY